MSSDFSGRARRQVGLIEFEGMRRAKTAKINDGGPATSVLDKTHGLGRSLFKFKRTVGMHINRSAHLTQHRY